MISKILRPSSKKDFYKLSLKTNFQTVEFSFTVPFKSSYIFDDDSWYEISLELLLYAKSKKIKIQSNFFHMFLDLGSLCTGKNKEYEKYYTENSNNFKKIKERYNLEEIAEHLNVCYCVLRSYDRKCFLKKMKEDLDSTASDNLSNNDIFGSDESLLNDLCEPAVSLVVPAITEQVNKEYKTTSTTQLKEQVKRQVKKQIPKEHEMTNTTQSKEQRKLIIEPIIQRFPIFEKQVSLERSIPPSRQLMYELNKDRHKDLNTNIIIDNNLILSKRVHFDNWTGQKCFQYLRDLSALKSTGFQPQVVNMMYDFLIKTLDKSSMEVFYNDKEFIYCLLYDLSMIQKNTVYKKQINCSGMALRLSETLKNNPHVKVYMNYTNNSLIYQMSESTQLHFKSNTAQFEFSLSNM